jgi:uncharacterized protein YeaO (DUF488 family)
MKLFTIGFTGKTAQKFFQLLKDSKATKVIDIRINRTSQLAGFAKEQDLKYFLPKLNKMDYLVREDLAPTKALLAEYRNKEVDWVEFSQRYQDLLHARGAIESLTPEIFNNSVLLCSESESEMCHRTLLANRLVELYPGLTVTNLF